MSYIVENVEVLAPVNRHTQVPRIVPLYEVALIKYACDGRQVVGPRKVPGRTNARSHLTKAGRKAISPRDRYAENRTSEFESIEEEEQRLRARYAFFDAVFPTSRAFADHAKSCYPDQLSEVTVNDYGIAPAEGDDIGEDIPEAATEAEEPASTAFETEGPDVSALEALPYIDHDDAIELFNAGIQTVEDVVNAEPGRIGDLIDGVSTIREKQIREAAEKVLFE